jgi:hypothetical protein
VKTAIKVLTICLIAINSACAPALINLPEVKAKDCPVLEQTVCPKPVECPKLDSPEPVPKNLVINIKDGKVKDIDAGGELLIRQYIATRKAISAAWSK